MDEVVEAHEQRIDRLKDAMEVTSAKLNHAVKSVASLERGISKCELRMIAKLEKKSSEVAENFLSCPASFEAWLLR